MNKPSHEYCKECNDWNGNISKCMEICGIPIDIINEWEKYRSIGTPDECREAVEKQKAKKPVDQDEEYSTFKCPICGGLIFTEDRFETHKHCLLCGQKLDWSD